jgi:hypothetical protein
MKTITQPQTQTLPSLGFCLAMDLIGCLSFTIPGIGEFSDVIWAPLSAFIFLKSFGGRFGIFGSALNFIEEAIPFTDFIPTFTIAYFLRKNAISKFSLMKNRR